MAKATIKYDLNDPDDSMDFSRAVKATDMALALWDIQLNLKREFEGTVEHDNATLEAVFDRIYSILDEYNINADELVR
jgi:hypothetical protein